MGRDIPIDSINRYSKYEVGDRILCKGGRIFIIVAKDKTSDIVYIKTSQGFILAVDSFQLPNLEFWRMAN